MRETEKQACIARLPPICRPECTPAKISGVPSLLLPPYPSKQLTDPGRGPAG